MNEKWKIHEKVVTHFEEFIGFMVCKTTGSISRSFLLKKIGQKCSVVRDIGKTKREKSSNKCKYLWIQSIFFRFFSCKNEREIEPVVLHTINPLNSTKCVTTFSRIFHFSFIDFSRKIYETFFLKWGMPFGYRKLYTRSK